MKPAHVSFRGARIGILGCSDADRLALSRQINRIGATIAPVAPTDIVDAASGCALDALFLDLDAEQVRGADWTDAGRRLPVVALVGSEAPSQLNLMGRLSVSAHLMKPVRTTGILTALWAARQSFAERRSLETRIDRLDDRLRLRRFVVSAHLDLMTRLGISETEAFARLRAVAMQQRTTVEEICLKYVANEVSVPD